MIVHPTKNGDKYHSNAPPPLLFLNKIDGDNEILDLEPIKKKTVIYAACVDRRTTKAVNHLL